MDMICDSRHRGFTLLEVMIAVSLMGVIMTLIWTSSSQSFRAKDRTEARDAVFHSAQVALRKISDDVTAAFLTKRSTTTTATEGGTAAGETTTTAAYKSFFIGEDRGDQDALRFTSLAHVRLIKNAKESDQTRIAYEVVQAEGERDKYNVMRREQAWLTDTDEVGGNAFALLENVLTFNLEYYDERKKEWVKEWNTDKVDWRDRLPMAIKVSVVFPDPDGGDQNIPVSTATTLPMYASTID